ncbi:hypothetical protein CBL_06699 [Carabus blaptoides fortunei]
MSTLTHVTIMDPVGFNFVKSIPGLFKILEIIFSLLAFICAMIFNTSWSWSLLAFFNTMALMCLCYAAIMILFHVIHCTTGFSSVPWHKLDCVLCILLAVLVFISSSLFIYYSKPVSLEAAVVFGFCNAFDNAYPLGITIG